MHLFFLTRVYVYLYVFHSLGNLFTFNIFVSFYYFQLEKIIIEGSALVYSCNKAITVINLYGRSSIHFVHFGKYFKS